MLTRTRTSFLQSVNSFTNWASTRIRFHKFTDIVAGYRIKLGSRTQFTELTEWRTYCIRKKDAPIFRDAMKMEMRGPEYISYLMKVECISTGVGLKSSINFRIFCTRDKKMITLTFSTLC